MCVVCTETFAYKIEKNKNKTKVQKMVAAHETWIPQNRIQRASFTACNSRYYGEFVIFILFRIVFVPLMND